MDLRGSHVPVIIPRLPETGRGRAANQPQAKAERAHLRLAEHAALAHTGHILDAVVTRDVHTINRNSALARPLSDGHRQVWRRSAVRVNGRDDETISSRDLCRAVQVSAVRPL